jgi:hypothetical protein
MGLLETILDLVDITDVTKYKSSPLKLLLPKETNSRRHHRIRLKMLCFCVGRGLSVAHREHEIAIGGTSFLLYRCNDLRFAKLFVTSGAACNEGLSLYNYEAAEPSNESEVEFVRFVEEAASTVCSLKHLARMEVSHAIGYHPGRPERIKALPVPEIVKRQINFKDVLEEFEDEYFRCYPHSKDVQLSDDDDDEYEQYSNLSFEDSFDDFMF